jgi:hypothetical protein
MNVNSCIDVCIYVYSDLGTCSLRFFFQKPCIYARPFSRIFVIEADVEKIMYCMNL